MALNTDHIKEYNCYEYMFGSFLVWWIVRELQGKLIFNLQGATQKY